MRSLRNKAFTLWHAARAIVGAHGIARVELAVIEANGDVRTRVLDFVGEEPKERRKM